MRFIKYKTKAQYESDLATSVSQEDDEKIIKDDDIVVIVDIQELITKGVTVNYADPQMGESGAKIVPLTQEEYDQKALDGEIDPDTYYAITN